MQIAQHHPEYERFWPVKPVPCSFWGEVCWVSQHPDSRRQPCAGCPGKPKTARNRLTGNAVVPQVAALAWSVLSE